MRVSIEVSRQTEGSAFVQTISLSAGDEGNRVEVDNAIDWRGLASNLKVAFRSPRLIRMLRITRTLAQSNGLLPLRVSLRLARIAGSI